jgi:GTP-binding protein
VHRLLPQLRHVWASYRSRVTTRELNTWLDQVTQRVPPPLRGDRPLRLKYVTQAESRPPRFVVFSNGRVPDAYRRYLERELRAAYGFTGVPIVVENRPPRDRQRAARRR